MRNKIFVVLFGVIFLTGCTSIMTNLGVSNGKLAACPNKPNCVSSQSTDDQHAIAPLVFEGSKEAAHKRVIEILHATKRAKIITNEADYIHAEFTSMVFRFVDDVEFYFLEEQDGKAIIDIRSASRVGHSDLGVNRKRMENIRRKL